MNLRNKWAVAIYAICILIAIALAIIFATQANLTLAWITGVVAVLLVVLVIVTVRTRRS